MSKQRRACCPTICTDPRGMAEENCEKCYAQVYDRETVEYLKTEFDRLKDNCYLDHAGATLYSKTQIKNVADDLSSNLYGNPHSLGSASKLTLDIIDQIRFRILDHFHTSCDEYSVIFTSSATASLKLVSESFAFSKYDEIQGGGCGKFVYLQDNHTSVLGMREVVAERGAEVFCLGHEEAFKIFHGERSRRTEPEVETRKLNSLFVYPAQCNFSGLKYPLEWVKITTEENALDYLVDDRRSEWFTMLDAASYVATNDLDLAKFKPDFVCLSFYKIFGYPTGIGALLVRNSSAGVLRKVYYGGGTVEISLSSDMFHSKRPVLHERFEDGTLPFLSIASLRHGFEVLEKIPMQKISQHVFGLAKCLHDSLLVMHHSNGSPIAKLYSDTAYEDARTQGGVVTFNLLRPNGETVGFVEFLNMSNLHKIHVRTGCFCNPGACQRHLKLSNEELKEHFSAGHVCGDERDLVKGKPTGGIRVSFGYMSTMSEVTSLIELVKKCFVHGPEVEKVPDWWGAHRMKVRIRHGDVSSTSDLATIRPSSDQHDLDEGYFENVVRNGDGISTDARIVLEEDGEEEEDGRDEKVAKCKLRRLYIYPVKSCAAYEIPESWVIGNRGLNYDREWMITTASGVCLTQKQEVKLCLIRPVIRRADNVLELNYPGMPSIKVPLKIAVNDPRPAGAVCRSKICGHRVEGTDCGSDVSEWLSLSLGRPGLRLVKQNSEAKVKNGPDISFSSQAQYLLINQASIRWLAEKITPDSECDKDTILDRFRGNIVVDGCEPFDEMKWTSIKIGKTMFRVDGQCTRCQMICVDQNTGKKTVEPLRTLAEEFHGKMRFGIYLSRECGGNEVIRIGDQIAYQ
ncbi:molybdenum cofactor sulfurase 1 isoform X2 [Neodiprion pinetum]|uniref:molybdenum cofactor sulfurase 1 isoform X2 n=1 Tax=Neodiprion pinetum TaxID=441929 RepID=UPI001EDF6589|nr:molybdenum cofactor sulfurase isoform X2 [Neodiprion pinetum]